MASYHCSIKPVSRGGGRSGTAAAAYRAGVCLADERTGEVHDYTRKQGIEHTELVLPNGVDFDREQLWNTAEASEKRKDARVAREFELALPAELTPEQRRDLAVEFARHLVERYGVAADVAVHEPNRKGDQRNHHAHILVTTRQISAQGLGEKTDLEREDKALRSQGKPSGRDQVKALRAEWATKCNAALERAGHDARIDHRTLEAQGIDREPTTHLGPVATAMERRGLRTVRGDMNRELAQVNEQLKSLKNARSELEAVSVAQTPPATVPRSVRRTGPQILGQKAAPAQFVYKTNDTLEDLVGAPAPRPKQPTPEELLQRVLDKQAAEKAAAEREADRALVEQERPKVEAHFLRLRNVEPYGTTLEQRQAEAKRYADQWAALPAEEREGYKERQSQAIRDDRPRIKAEKKQSRARGISRG